MTTYHVTTVTPGVIVALAMQWANTECCPLAGVRWEDWWPCVNARGEAYSAALEALSTDDLITYLELRDVLVAFRPAN